MQEHGSATRTAAAAPGGQTMGRGHPPPVPPSGAAPSAGLGSWAPALGSPGALGTCLRGPLGLQKHTSKRDLAGSFQYSPMCE